MSSTIQILGISGSLRSNSSNTNILKIMASLFPDRVSFQLFEKLDQIPPFNPGNDDNDAVKDFKKVVAESDGVIICTPEYAFGVPGVLKNALDWTVATGEFNEKPVSAVSASPLNSGGDKALASLLLTLTALGTKRNGRSSLAIPNIKLRLTPEGTLNHPETLELLQFQTDNLLSLIAQ